MKMLKLLKKEQISDRILFVSSATTSPDAKNVHNYFASMIAELAYAIQKNAKNFDLVIKVPSAESGQIAGQQVEFISSAIADAQRYKCIVCAPSDRNTLYGPLRNWIETYPGNRLIFIDQGYPADEEGVPNNETRYLHFHKEDVPRPPYVQANWYQGGQVAGESMIKLMLHRGISAPNFVLVEGIVGSGQRMAGFKKAVEEKQKDDANFSPSISQIIQGNYSKKNTVEAFEKCLLTHLKEHKAISGIFAANDEMALGVRDVLMKYKSQYVNAVPKNENGEIHLPAIIGFDGTRELTFYIDINDEFIYDTVDVRLVEQVEKIAEIVRSIVFGYSLDEDMKWVQLKCRSYRDSRNCSHEC